ncbi:MAG TPA: hypothetical protein ENH41_01440 [Candidatus Omnitrophica bacterium]|nr:hypothetical protein [Candidatus Omnitrophota bacterium]
MMFTAWIETSIFISLLKKGWEGYSFIEWWWGQAYKDSCVYRLSGEFWKRVRVCFRYSFFGKITEISQPGTITFVIFDNSHTVQYLGRVYNRVKDQSTRYLKMSFIADCTERIKQQVSFLPIQAISIVVITAVSINILLSILLQKQFGLWGWFMRGVFLFLGIAGLFSKSKDNS